eukprot:TRINITY_DN2543_c0_g1_i2.p1 TRINITY_DN2543_c0_g1~~TRINITY_DN2543_c0_g1_i2.p1  ORF type:complete len:154 (+),score=2.15 TRINITY_DN2543_c0_g1_i2:340-801(+)
MQFAYRAECPDFSNLIIGFIANNVLWLIWSCFVHRAIDSRNSETLRRYTIALAIITLIRAATYIATYIVMSETSFPDRKKWYCAAVYQAAVYAFQGIAETAWLIALLYLLYTIREYIISEYCPCALDLQLGKDRIQFQIMVERWCKRRFNVHF